MLNLLKDTWKLIKQITNMLDICNSINIENLILYKNKNLCKPISYKYKDIQDGILIKFNHVVMNMVIGINLICGRCGTGKSTMLHQIIQQHNNTLILTQVDIIHNTTVKNNIIGSLPYKEDIFQNISSMFKLHILTQPYDEITPNILSGGERKILNILRFIYYIEYYENTPNKYLILLLDEPMNQLDSDTSKILVEYIQNKRHKYIIILVDHSRTLKHNISKTFYIK